MMGKNSDKVQSWVVMCPNTGKVYFETWSERVVNALNPNKAKAVPILEYLQGLNKQIEKDGYDAANSNVVGSEITP